MEQLKALGRILPRLIVAVGAGALLGLAFEPHDHPWLAFLAVPLLLAALNGVSMKAGFLIGSGFGITYYAVLVPWLSIIGGDAAIALAILEGLFYGVFGMFASQTLKHRLWILWVPCLWVATEFATASVPFGGFPWGRSSPGPSPTRRSASSPRWSASPASASPSPSSASSSTPYCGARAGSACGSSRWPPGSRSSAAVR